MRVTNNTVWRTDHLKAILQKAAEQEFDDGARRKRLHVTVDYTRGGGCSGYAWYDSNRAVVRIANPKGTVTRLVSIGDGASRYRRVPLTFDLTDLKLQFAKVACHEFAHCRGMKHAQMPAYYRWGSTWEAYVAWAADMPLELAPVKTKAVPTVDIKLAHVERRLKVALTRLKRAKTLVTKWEKKRRYYLKRLNTLPVAAAVSTFSSTHPILTSLVWRVLRSRIHLGAPSILLPGFGNYQRIAFANYTHPMYTVGGG